MSEEEMDKLDEELEEFSKSLNSYKPDGVTITQLIETLTKIKEKHGDLKVWYQSDYDWALPIHCVSVAANEHLDNTPEEITVYFN